MKMDSHLDSSECVLPDLFDLTIKSVCWLNRLGMITQINVME